MVSYIIKRILQSVLIIFLVSIFCFSLIYLMPGDPILAIYGADIEPAQYQKEFKEMGLDKPIYERYIMWISKFVRGDMGKSVKYAMPVSELIKARLPVTLYLGFIALGIGTAMGILFGILSSLKRGSPLDAAVTIAANIGTAVPLFWLGVVGIYIFAVMLGWLPSFGFKLPWKDGWISSFKQTILPVIGLSVGLLSSTTRQLRSSMLEVINLDYIRSVRAKGVNERNVIRHHALPNAMIPVLTLLGLSFRFLVTGSVSIEKVFNIQGMGTLLVTAIFGRDAAVTQASILIIAMVVSAASLIVDISYGLVDPRVRIK